MKAVPDHLETGGLLLGTSLGHGRLVTHATPPGPNAIHQEGMFGKDMDFSQAILNHLAKKTGVDYVGEWHKHPPYFNKPSIGDREGAIQILKDSDYRTNGLLVFPIWTTGKRSHDHRIAHQSLIEHYVGSMDAVQCFPYYMDETGDFYPFEFQMVRCDLSTQSEVVRFHERYLAAHRGSAINSQGRWTGRDGMEPCEKGDGANNKEERPKSADEPEGPAKSRCLSTPSSFWYDTQEGRERLAQEIKYLDSSRCYRGAKRLPDGRLLFRLSSPVFKDVFLDILCGQDHPLSVPDLFLQYGRKYKLLNVDAGSVADKKDLVSSHQRIDEMNRLWGKSGSEMLISDIAKYLGFD